MRKVIDGQSRNLGDMTPAGKLTALMGIRAKLEEQKKDMGRLLRECDAGISACQNQLEARG
jgi:hypothetical protein